MSADGMTQPTAYLDELDKTAIEEEALTGNDQESIRDDDIGSDSGQSAGSGASATPANVFTTSGGDGLSFISGEPNIFERIEAIKYGSQRLSITSSQEGVTDEDASDVSKTEPVPLLNDLELAMEELPESIRPISTLIEIVQHLETLKESLRPQSDAEAEFLRVLRQLKLNDKIFTCSNSLELLVDKYRTTVDERDSMVERLDTLEKENFYLKSELTEKQAVATYLQEQTKAQGERLDYLQRENKQLTIRLEYVSKQRDESDLMQESERIKMLYDS